MPHKRIPVVMTNPIMAPAFREDFATIDWTMIATIIIGLTKRPFALCEDHYNECKSTGKLKYTIEWDE